MTVWDFDLASKDDLLGHVDVELGDYTYCNEIRRDMYADLDTKGELVVQVWWEPETDGDGHDAAAKKRQEQRRGGRQSRIGVENKRTWRGLLRRAMCYFIPVKLQTFRGCCTTLCIKVLHPDSKFRSGWNICLAVLILYCGFAVPLEIAFETDMVDVMCYNPEDLYGPNIIRNDCKTYLTWFWMNFVVDLWFMVDITLNFRASQLAPRPANTPLGHPPIISALCSSLYSLPCLLTQSCRAIATAPQARASSPRATSSTTTGSSPRPT